MGARVTLRQLVWLRRAAVATQSCVGVVCAFGAMLLVDEGAYFAALLCIAGFVRVARERIPDLPK